MLIPILSFIASFLGAGLATIIFGKKAGQEGIRRYLDRKEEELNEKFKRKTF